MLHRDNVVQLLSSDGRRNFGKGVWGGGEDNVSTPSSFIANAHNELYAFYTGKGGLLQKIRSQ